MAGSVIRQDELNHALWLATRGGKMELSCQLWTTYCVLQKKFPQKPYTRTINPLLTKLVRLCLGLKTPKKKSTWPISSHLDLTLGQLPTFTFILPKTSSQWWIFYSRFIGIEFFNQKFDVSLAVKTAWQYIHAKTRIIMWLRKLPSCDWLIGSDDAGMVQWWECLPSATVAGV